MGEVKAHIHLILRILEIVNPASGIRIHIHNVGVDKIPHTAERTRDGLTVNDAIIVHVCRVLRNHHHLIGISLKIRVQITLIRVKAILALGSHHIIEHLIAIVQLLHIQHLLPGHRVIGIDTLHGTFLVFIRIARQSLVPIQMWGDWLTIFILLNLVALVAPICRVSQTFTNDGVTYPIDKLTIHGVGHLFLIHPESIHADVPCRHILAPQAVCLFRTHLEATTLH